MDEKGESHGRTYVIKYGGNAMINETVKRDLLRHICSIVDHGHKVIIVHGGGPFIEEALARARIKSEFIEGQRVTSKEALVHVETTLKGYVNASLVGILNALGKSAVGLSGKDGKLVTAAKRFGKRTTDGIQTQVDLGHVGDVEIVETRLLTLLLENGYIPVITCIAADAKGVDYNINADVFAGHIAGAMHASEFILLTDVDGVLKDIEDQNTLISTLTRAELDNLMQTGVIRGGMIPKLEACKTALKKGAKRARIINGTKPEQLARLVNQKRIGTLITD